MHTLDIEQKMFISLHLPRFAGVERTHTSPLRSKRNERAPEMPRPRKPLASRAWRSSKAFLQLQGAAPGEAPLCLGGRIVGATQAVRGPTKHERERLVSLRHLCSWKQTDAEKAAGGAHGTLNFLFKS